MCIRPHHLLVVPDCTFRFIGGGDIGAPSARLRFVDVDELPAIFRVVTRDCKTKDNLG